MAAEEFNFGQFSSKIFEHYDGHVRNLKDLCVTKSVMKPASFFDSLHKEVQASSAELTHNRELGSVSDYADLFKTFDEYPSNLPKLPNKKRGELQRTGAEAVFGLDQDHFYSVFPNLTSRVEKQLGAKQVHKDFIAFQYKMSKVLDQAAAADKAEFLYLERIKQVQSFAQQLKKLMPLERTSPEAAYTPKETELLLTIAENMQQLNYLKSHQLPVVHEMERQPETLQKLMEVVDYTLIQINGYKNV